MLKRANSLKKHTQQKNQLTHERIQSVKMRKIEKLLSSQDNNNDNNTFGI